VLKLPILPLAKAQSSEIRVFGDRSLPGTNVTKEYWKSLIPPSYGFEKYRSRTHCISTEHPPKVNTKVVDTNMVRSIYTDLPVGTSR
jgi:hypothetical protein